MDFNILQIDYNLAFSCSYKVCAYGIISYVDLANIACCCWCVSESPIGHQGRGPSKLVNVHNNFFPSFVSVVHPSAEFLLNPNFKLRVGILESSSDGVVSRAHEAEASGDDDECQVVMTERSRCLPKSRTRAVGVLK